nr:hypothetical protein [Spirochaetales bacterium]
LYDQVVSFCDGNISMNMIREKMGLVGVDVINKLAEHLTAGERTPAIELLHEIFAQGVSVEKCIIDLTEYFRTLLLIKEGITKETLIGARAEQFSPKVVKTLTSSQIEAALDLLLNLYRNIRFSLNQRFELELAISKLTSIRLATSPAGLLQQLEELQKKLLSSSTAANAASSHTQGTAAKQADQLSETFFNNNEAKKPVSGRAPVQIETASSQIEQDELAAPQQTHEKREPLSLQAKHFEILQAQLKQDYPSLASALQQIDSWDLEDHHVTLIFSTTYAAEHAKQRTKELTSRLSKVVDTNLGITITSKQKQQRHREQTKKNTESDDTVELSKKIFRGELHNNE